ncbi:hypothetical protein ChUKH1_04195 [Cryptosporidium hominis]|nr:hypothetical protein ChUKH1_04195 [Cryptosporidium hominis]
MIIEQKTGDEIKKLTGRNIIWSPNELGIPYLGLYEEHGKIGNEDYLRYGVRYIGNKAINGNNEIIIIGEIYGELLSLDSLVFRSKEFEYTELNSSLNWIWRYNGVVIDTRNITGILGFIQKTWKESDESNCHLEVIDGRLYVTSNPNVCIYPGDELVLSVNNNMDLLIPTIGDEVMKLRSRSRKIEQKLERFSYKESPKSCEATAVSVSSASTVVTKNKSGINDEYDNNNNVSVPYSLNCTNEYYCNLCSRSQNNAVTGSNHFYYGELRFSTRIFKNALVFVLGEKENILGLTENQIHYFDRWKSTSCDRELYALASTHKISFKSKRGVSIETIQNESETDQTHNFPIETLLVKNCVSKSINEMIISEFQLVRDDKSHNFGDLTRKCYISKSVLLYYFFEKWMNEKFVGEYKYLRIPIPMLIEQHRQLLLPYPEGIQWDLETLSWRYNIQKNIGICKQEIGNNFSLEASINDHIAQEQEYVGVRVTNENDSFELFKNYITICSIKYKSANQSKSKDMNSSCSYNSSRADYNMDYQSNSIGNKKKRQKEFVEVKNKEYEHELFEIEAQDISRKIGNNFSESPDNDLVSIHEIIDKCSEIKSIDQINSKNKQLLTVVSDDIGIISQQVEIILVPPYSSFIKFCVKRLGFSITYNKRRAWFSVRSRGVLEAFNLAIKWIKKQKSINEKNHANNYLDSINNKCSNLENVSSSNNQSINSKCGINGKRSSLKIGNNNNNNNKAHFTFTKAENNINFCQDSDTDSVLSLNEQANRLKPLPKRIIWVPSRRVFIVSYKRLGAINQMNTKSFNPTIYGGVKKALKHACIFQSQTEQCKFNGFADNSGVTEANSSYSSVKNKIDSIDEKSRMESSLKPLNYWVRSIDSKVSSEKVTNAYREAVSTYLTQSTTFSQNNTTLGGPENYCEMDLEQNANFLSLTPNLESSQKECMDGSYTAENAHNTNENVDFLESQVRMKMDESYINNFNTDYAFSGEPNALQTMNENLPLNKDFEANEAEYSQNIEFKPFKMYHDQVFINKDSALNLMNIDEVLNLYSSNGSNVQNDSTDGQTIILDEEICSTENLIGQESLCNSSVADYMNSFEDYKIPEPLISISDPYTNIMHLDDPPTLHDQYIKMVSPYEYIDSFTLIEP